MSDGNRDEILANFQAASGLEDIGIAIAILEQQSWDLQKALQSYLDDGAHSHATTGADNLGNEVPRVPMCEPSMPLVEDETLVYRPHHLPVFSGASSGASASSSRSSRTGAQSKPRSNAERASGGGGNGATGAAATNSGRSGSSASKNNLGSRSGGPSTTGGIGSRTSGSSANVADVGGRSGARPTAVGTGSRTGGVETRSSSRGTGISAAGVGLGRSGGVETRSSGRSGAAGGSLSSTGGGRTADASGVGSNREVQAKPRLLLFKVRLEDNLIDQTSGSNRRQSVCQVIVHDTDTVLDIKRQLHQMIDQPIAIEDMRLRGFPSSVNDSTVLERLHLPKETSLTLASANPDLAQRTTHQRAANYCLTVLNADRNCSQQFYYEPDACVGRLRSDVYSLWGIPTNSQSWSGWQLNWSATFALSGLPSRQDLIVRRSQPSHSSASPQPASSAATAASPSADDDYADYDFEYEEHEQDIDMEESPGARRREHLPPRSAPLIRPGCTSDVEGTRQFVDNFAARYGTLSPVFHTGSLSSAVEEADGRSLEDRKPLALYLHHDKSIAAQIFCSNVLAHHTIIEYLNANFVLWPWDLTQIDNMTTLVNVAARQLGLDAADRVRQMMADDLPAILVLAHRPRAPHEVIGDVQGVSDPSAALTMLVKLCDDFETLRRAEKAEEDAREQRTMERLEMESAYEESLRVDRQKEQQREAKLRQEREEQERVQAEQALALSLLPDEPPAGQKAATVRFRMPGGAGTRQRRFNPGDRLRHLSAYCASLGYPQASYALVTAFPRRTLSELDQETTLEQAGFVPQETVLLEEK